MIYERLSTVSSIRLFTLFPGSYDQLIIADLFEVDLNYGCPAFEAVSYTWGSEHDQQTIYLNGEMIQIRSNLFDCLLRLRLADEERLLWVDALCISQTDLQEKASQVRMIGQIFHKADCVLAWVGEHADDSKLLFEYFRDQRAVADWPRKAERKARIDHHYRDRPVGEYSVGRAELYEMIGIKGWTGGDALHPDTRIVPWGSNKEQDVRISLACARFAARPYWGRLWIVQELAVAESVQFHCGDISLDWSALFDPEHGMHAVSAMLGSTSAKERSFEILRQIDVSRTHFELRMRLPKEEYSPGAYSDLPTFCASYVFSQCLDRRDRVYALLSLDIVSHEDLKARPPNQLTVDYTIDIPELFLRTCWSSVYLDDDLVLSDDPKNVLFSDIERRAPKKRSSLEDRDLPLDDAAVPNLVKGLHMNVDELRESICRLLRLIEDEPTPAWKRWCFLGWRLNRMFCYINPQAQFPLQMSLSSSETDAIMKGSIINGLRLVLMAPKHMSKSTARHAPVSYPSIQRTRRKLGTP